MKRIGNLYDYFLSRECAEEALWKGIEHKRKSKQVRKLWRDGTQYLPINKDGNSTFVIPVQTLDEPLAVSAETTAMSEPHMIDYSLVFDAATVTEKRPEGLFGPGLGGAGTAAVVAGLALLAGGIVFMQRRGGADGSGGPSGLGGRKGRAGR